MKGLTLTTREQARLSIMNAVLEGRWRVSEAAELMAVSERHTWRLLAAYRDEGVAAIAHGNRGRVPANATPESLRAKVTALARDRYQGVNHTHLTELLAEREGVLLSRSTVRRLLAGAGLSSPRHRRPPRHRYRRERMPQEGMLVQVDGSHHRWLEERGPWFTLLLAVDDATGKVPYALFQEQEDTEGYFRLMAGIIQRHGVPLAIYSDRHLVFRRPGADETIEAPVDMNKLTQFGRAMRELGVPQVFARSPEAKGRIERANGTFQDRLVAELRLAGASSIEEANTVLEAFLPRFNERFGVPAAQPEVAYRPLDPGTDVGGMLCFKERRRVARDNTVQYHGHTLQIFPGMDRLSYAGVRVEVQERLDGRLTVAYRGRVLTPGEAPPLAATLRERALLPPPSILEAEKEEPTIPKRPKVIWYEDSEMMRAHSELVKAGMERARQQGKRIGRPRVTERPDFLHRFAVVLERLARGELSRRRAAKDLSIGYATLKRLMEARGLWASPPLADAVMAEAH